MHCVGIHVASDHTCRLSISPSVNQICVARRRRYTPINFLLITATPQEALEVLTPLPSTFLQGYIAAVQSGARPRVWGGPGRLNPQLASRATHWIFAQNRCKIIGYQLNTLQSWAGRPTKLLIALKIHHASSTDLNVIFRKFSGCIFPCPHRPTGDGLRCSLPEPTSTTPPPPLVFSPASDMAH